MGNMHVKEIKLKENKLKENKLKLVWMNNNKNSA